MGINIYIFSQFVCSLICFNPISKSGFSFRLNLCTISYLIRATVGSKQGSTIRLSSCRRSNSASLSQDISPGVICPNTICRQVVIGTCIHRSRISQCCHRTFFMGIDSCRCISIGDNSSFISQGHRRCIIVNTIAVQIGTITIQANTVVVDCHLRTIPKCHFPTVLSIQSYDFIHFPGILSYFNFCS